MQKLGKEEYSESKRDIAIFIEKKRMASVNGDANPYVSL